MREIKAWAIKGKDGEGEYLTVEYENGPPHLFRTRDNAKDHCETRDQRPVRVTIRVEE